MDQYEAIYILPLESESLLKLLVSGRLIQRGSVGFSLRDYYMISGSRR